MAIERHGRSRIAEHSVQGETGPPADAVNQARVDQARAGGRASLSLNGVLGYAGTAVPFDRHNYNSDVTVSATLRQPLFAGGSIASQVRQASELESSTRLQIDLARRSVIQAVSQAWSQRRAAQLNLVSAQTEVSASQAAFDGMRVEYRAGLRSTLDVLIAQQTLRNAQITQSHADHDQKLAEAALLAAVGRLEARMQAPEAVAYSRQSLTPVDRIGASPWDILPQALDRVPSPSLDLPLPPLNAGRPHTTP